MNIISNYSRDTQTGKEKPGSYEWWYFDAQSVDGYKIVVIFYEGNPFSRRYINALERGKNPKASQFPALSISVYQKGNPVYYSFREVEPQAAEFSSEIPSGRIEKNRFQFKYNQTRLEYILDLDQELATGDSIQAKLTFSADILSLPNLPSPQSPSDSHEWNIVMPSGNVHGKINIDGYQKEEIKFTGLGYHDHNAGFEPLNNSFREWYWGRFHLGDSTFIYYLMNRDGFRENNAWLIDKDGTALPCGNIEISGFSLSFFGLKSARVVECTAGEKKIFVQLDELLDNGPFYQRFGGRLLLKEENGVKEARGISEYLRPSRIHYKRYWPLANMRIAYPGTTHWVQRNPVLYRWTW